MEKELEEFAQQLHAAYWEGSEIGSMSWKDMTKASREIWINVAEKAIIIQADYARTGTS